MSRESNCWIHQITRGRRTSDGLTASILATMLDWKTHQNTCNKYECTVDFRNIYRCEWRHMRSVGRRRCICMQQRVASGRHGALLKVRNVRNPTPSIDAHLPEEQSCQILYSSNLKQWRRSLFWTGSPQKEKKKKNNKKWVAKWEQFQVQKSIEDYSSDKLGWSYVCINTYNPYTYSKNLYQKIAQVFWHQILMQVHASSLTNLCRIEWHLEWPTSEFFICCDFYDNLY